MKPPSLRACNVQNKDFLDVEMRTKSDDATLGREVGVDIYIFTEHLHRGTAKVDKLGDTLFNTIKNKGRFPGAHRFKLLKRWCFLPA